MSAKHTPGPWEYFPAQNFTGFAVAPLGRLPINVICEACNYPSATEANARLIAAAPDLLAAAKRAEHGLRELCEGQDPANECWNVLCETQAAIAKAEGGA